MIDPYSIAALAIGGIGSVSALYGAYTIRKTIKKWDNPEKIGNFLVDTVINLLESEEFAAELNKIMSNAGKIVGRGAMQGAIPKIKIEDAIGLAIYGMIRKYMPQGAPAAENPPQNLLGQ